MWLRRPLDDILSSPAKVAILRAVFNAPAPMSGRERIRSAGTSYGPGWQALQELVASGVLTKTDHGRATTYELRNPDEALIGALRDLFWTEQSRSREFGEDLAHALPEARSIILYGSEARGEANSGSDTDLLIVVEEKTEALEEKIIDACLEVAARHEVALSWHVADIARMREWEHSDSDFWRNVQEDGIVLHGERIERLKRLCQHGRAT